MPDHLADLTIGEIIAWVAGIGALAGVLYKIWGPIKALQNFLRDWSGKPARKDRTGRTIEDAEAGVLGKLDTMRADLDRVLKQVENSHNTNFRDDLDVVRASVERVGERLDEHIVISKDHDRFQNQTRESLDQHIKSTQKWTYMLEDLSDLWGKKPEPPDESD
ncbi:MAG: DUF2746 domain-containing protein [Micrococcaceae bacterium]|nr:DUF2746 domain-containing protein [Micrococcaceae bacterium]